MAFKREMGAKSESPAIAGLVIRLSTPARYGVAIVAAIIAVLARLALDPVWGVKLPYITLFPAIMVFAWLGGLWPGILTTLITGTAAAYYWVQPSDSFRITEPSEWLGLVVFVAVGVVITALNHAWRSSAAALADSEEHLKVTLASIGDAVIATDAADGCVLHMNPVAERLTGWTEAEATHKRLDEIFVNEQTRLCAHLLSARRWQALVACPACLGQSPPDNTMVPARVSSSIRLARVLASRWRERFRRR